MRFPPAITVFALVCCAAPAFAQSASEEPASNHVVVRPGKSSAPAWLGVRLGPADDAKGTPILGVMRRSPAQLAGLQPGDRLLTVDGVPVESLRDLLGLLRPRRPGEKVKAVALRSDKRLSLEIALEEKPHDEAIVTRHLVGFEAPSLQFQFVGDGKTTDLRGLRGKPTVVEFWATWCAPCRYVQQELSEVKTAFGDRINIVGVSSESMATVERYLGKKPARYAMAVTTDALMGDYLVQSLPTIVLLDSNHRVAAVFFGRGNKELVEKKLANLVEAAE